MARRSRHLLREVADLPWWVGLVIAGLVYLVMKFLVFSIFPSTPVAQGFARGVSNTAWLFALLFVGAALISAVRQFARSRLLDQQVNLESIRALPWQQFEHLVGEAFRRRGYMVEERGGGGADGGVDLVLFKSGKRVIVQCKRWKSTQVGVSPVRELYGVMTAEGADEAILVSSGSYTDEARAFADGKPIQLIAGRTLLEMIRSVQMTSRSDRIEPVPICPQCARTMVRRRARQGANAGQEFWGCPAFPECRGTRPI